METDIKNRIIRFQDEYGFLSNFYPAVVNLNGDKYPTVENAYQASKTLDLSLRKSFLNIGPGQAKRIGKNLVVWKDFEVSKYSIMWDLLNQKFLDDPLKTMLLNTGDLELIEGNNWHDNIWGSCMCDKCGFHGKNELGKLLMKIRGELRNEIRNNNY